MAETYHILDYRALPVELLATLVFGLRDNSRVKLNLAKVHVSADTLLLAAAVDRLSLLVWAQTKDAQRHRNPPKSFVEELTADAVEKKQKHLTFSSGEEFEAARAKILQNLTEKEV